ncbi:hypothetical protein [Nonomuraea jiangxiensis]|uniref:Uncharacterized protein n=1 Tax=Nonomuraea jiangxiensis TaxID=633440 RepID=A0A1G8CQ52_9ACTN|nr:hypothetical protein [Nonomuraea jiangxiensis]SDH47661.1 hypothetical protein SAMN05421869_102363 [Nonomuraea jiangxiensis]
MAEFEEIAGIWEQFRRLANPDERVAMKRRPVMVKVEESRLRVGAVTASNSAGN